MTNSLLDVRRGSQQPRVSNFPAYDLSAAPEVIDLAASAGLHLDEWQRYVLTHGLGMHADSRWTANRVSCWVPRQNGKGAIIEALELAWLFLFGEEEIIHSAHQHRTAQKAYLRLEKLIRTPRSAAPGQAVPAGQRRADDRDARRPDPPVQLPVPDGAAWVQLEEGCARRGAGTDPGSDRRRHADPVGAGRLAGVVLRHATG